MESLLLVARVGLSLAAVLGLLWWLGRRMQTSTTLRRRRREALVVVGRQQLGGKSGVAVIEASGRRLVVGYGEHGVSLLHDGGDIPEEEAPEEPSARGDLDRELIELTGASAGEPSHLDTEVMARASAPVHIRSTPARTADSQRHRSPLDGSILAPSTWRKAVVAAQEWTTRRS